MKARFIILTLLIAIIGTQVVLGDSPRRRMTPVNTAATATQPINETASDTSRINAKIRANSISYVDDRGRTIFVDTITGKEWTDSTALKETAKILYPKFHNVSVGLNVWDPLMRAFGQKYGIADAWVELSLYNRFKPVFEVGLGQANSTPSGSDFTYRSPLSVYFRLGANYNFLFKKDSDYSVYLGLRYGFSPFSFSVDDVHLNNSYWGENPTFNIPSQNMTVGWAEVVFGLRVKLSGPLSAGWAVKYQSILHQSKAPYGEPWYIPGFGSRNAHLSASFSFIYTFDIKSKTNKKVVVGVGVEKEKTVE